LFYIKVNLVVGYQNVTTEEDLALIVVFCEKQLCRIHSSTRPQSSIELFLCEETPYSEFIAIHIEKEYAHLFLFVVILFPFLVFVWILSFYFY